MKNTKLFYIFLLLFPAYGYCSPIISNLNGTIDIGKSATINGLNFGPNGPNVQIFDEFTGTPGQPVSLNATVGMWTTSDSPVYIADTGTNTAALSMNGTTMKQMEMAFSSVTEYFLSYKVKIPPGYHFPNTAANGDFATDSAWKLAWIFDGPDSSPGDDDICLPTWPNGTYFSLSGNDGGIKLSGLTASPEVGRPGYATNWFSFAGWNRVSTYMKGGANPVTDTGTIWLQGMSEEFGAKVFSFTDRTIFDGADGVDNDAISEWNYLTIPGWYRTGGNQAAYDSTTRAIYDDIYIATGPNAAARVEIGNDSTYKNCTKLAIATPEKWTDTSITATIRGGEFSKGDSVYIFVIDAKNNPSPGFGPIVISAPMIMKLQ